MKPGRRRLLGEGVLGAGDLLYGHFGYANGVAKNRQRIAAGVLG